MKQFFKAYRPLKAMIPLLMAAVWIVSCNNDAAKTDASTADSSSSKMTTTDSGASKITVDSGTVKPAKDTLPPIDTTVKQRPEERKAKKP